jgi:hypothetical protein
LPLYGGDIRWHSAGSGANIARWEALGILPGTYEVFATWMPASNRASDAPYRIYDGADAEKTTLVDQKNEPIGSMHGGRPFQSLGTYRIENNSLAVELSDDATGYVMADAVRIVRQGDLVPYLELQVSPTEIREGSGTATGTVTRSSGTVGDLVVTLASNDTGEATVPNEVTIPDGQSSATFVITAADDSEIDGLQQVTLTASAAGFDDGVANLDVADDEAFLIDDGDAGYTEVGTGWAGQSSSSRPIFGGDIRWHRQGVGNNKARWTVTGIMPGVYEVLITWMPATNRATNAPYTLYDGADVEASFTVNQENEPVGAVIVNRPFESMGTFPIDGTSVMLELSDNANEYVMADAVRFVRAGDLPGAVALAGSAASEASISMVTFGWYPGSPASSLDRTAGANGLLKNVEPNARREGPTPGQWGPIVENLTTMRRRQREIALDALIDELSRQDLLRQELADRVFAALDNCP